MSKKARRTAGPVLSSTAAATVFHPADVLFALEWSAVAPGLGGWNLLLDDERATRIISVVAPGAEQPTFAVSREGDQVVITWLRQGDARPPGARPMAAGGGAVRVGQFNSLRDAVLTLCPLGDELIDIVNEAMEILYPRALRDE